MLLTWTPQAWEDYLYWQATDKRTVKRINELLRDALRNPFEGLGKPEPLRFDLTGCWSRRINQEDRLVYRLDEQGAALIVLQCRYHYRGLVFAAYQCWQLFGRQGAALRAAFFPSLLSPSLLPRALPRGSLSAS